MKIVFKFVCRWTLVFIVGAAFIDDAMAAAEPAPDCSKAETSEQARVCFEIERSVREKGLLQQYPKKFSRQGDRLILLPVKGKPQVYKDVSTENDDGITYALKNYLPATGQAIVEYIGCLGECTHNLLIDMHSGNIKSAGNQQTLSPDKRRLAVWGGDYSFQFHFLAIYRVTPRGLVTELNIEPKEWWPENLVWETNERIRFDKTVANGDIPAPAEPTESSPVTLRWQPKRTSQDTKGVWTFSN